MYIISQSVALEILGYKMWYRTTNGRIFIGIKILKTLVINIVYIYNKLGN